MGVITDQTGLVLGQNNRVFFFCLFVSFFFLSVISLQLMKDIEKYIYLKYVNLIIST